MHKRSYSEWTTGKMRNETVLEVNIKYIDIIFKFDLKNLLKYLYFNAE